MSERLTDEKTERFVTASEIEQITDGMDVDTKPGSFRRALTVQTHQVYAAHEPTASSVDRENMFNLHGSSTRLIKPVKYKPPLLRRTMDSLIAKIRGL